MGIEMLKELSKKPIADLQVDLSELKQQLFNNRVLHQSGRLVKTHELKQLRRQIARLLTLIRYKEE